MALESFGWDEAEPLDEGGSHVATMPEPATPAPPVEPAAQAPATPPLKSFTWEEAEPAESAAQPSAAPTVGQKIARRMEVMKVTGQESPVEYVNKRLPILGGGLQVADSLKVLAAANRIKSGDYSGGWGEDHDVNTVAKYLTRQQHETDKGTAQKVFDTVSQIPGFAAEFAMTGGSYTGAKEATKKGLTKLVGEAAERGVGRAVTGVASRTAGVAAQTALNPQLVGKAVVARMLPEFQSTVDRESGDLHSVEIGADGESFLKALPKGYADAMIELGSERAGGKIVQGIGAVASKLPFADKLTAIKNAVAQRWLAAKPGRTITDLYNKTAQASGWNGVIGEVLEERAGDVGRLALGLEKPEENVTGQLLSGDHEKALKQLLVEGLAFSVPGATANIASRMMPQMNQSPAAAADQPAQPGESETNGAVPETTPPANETGPIPEPTGEKANLPSQPTDIAAWIHANPEAAQSLSEKVLAGEKISRKDFVKAGLPAGSREVRTAFANQIHGVLLSMAQQQGQQQTQQPSQEPPEQGSQQPALPPNQGPPVEPQAQSAAEPPATIPGPAETGQQPTAQTAEQQPSTSATPAQDALAAYAQQQGYDKIPTGKRGLGKRKVKDLINLRDSDVQHQALLKSAKAEAQQQAAASTKESNQADRAAAVEAGAQGKITPDVVKYAPLHTLPVELKQSIQDEAKRLITATKSDKVRTALERIVHDAGEDKGSAVEAQKQRIFGRLTGTVKTETFNEPPQPLDPIVKAITADPAERGKMIDAAVKSVEDGQPNDLALHADERLADANGVPQHQTPEGVDPFEHVPPPLRNSNADVTEWLEALRGSDHGQRELPPDSSAEQPFQLQNATPKPAPATFENKAGKQLNLIHGKDDLPGQQDLFPGMDNQNDEDVPEPVGAGSDAELGFPTRQQWDSDDPDTSGDIPSAIESPANAATSARPYIPPGPTMPTQRPATAVGKGASVVDVINAIRKATWAFGRETPIRIGRFRNKALGVFKVFPEVIRLKTANDVETAAHEIGHAIEKLVYGWNMGGPWKRPLVTNAMQQELSSLGRALYGNRVPAGGYKREGFAEYMRLWLTDPAAAKSAAPQFHGWFEGTFLPSHPKGAKYLQIAAKTFETYSQQGAVERAKQNIVDPLSIQNRAKKFLGNVGKIFSPTAVEGLYPLKGLKKRAESLSGNELPIHEDPYGSARALRSVAAARIKQMVENGMIDNSANYTGVAPLNDIKALVDEKDQGNFTALLWAQRAKALLEDPMGPRNPGPITIEDANEIIKELGTPKMLQAATLFHQWNDGVLDYVGQSSQTFQNSVDRIRARDPGFYSPLHREFDELERIWTASTGSDTNTGTVTGRLKGSGRRIINPLQVALTQAQQLVERAHERFILERVIGLQKIEGIGSLIEKVPPDRVVEMQKDLGQLVDDMTERLKRFGVELHDQQGNPIDPTQFAGTIATFFTDAKHAKNGEPIIPVYENGVTNWYYVDPGVYSALNKRNPSQVTEASKLIDWAATVFGRAPAHALRLGATGLWNPSFGLIINTIRDARTLSQNSQATNNFLVAYANVLKQVPWALADAVTNGKWSSDAVRTADRLGVKMAQSLHAQNPFTRRQASRLFGSKKILTLRNAGNLLDWVQNVIQFSDTAARAAEIDMLAKKEGIDLKQPLTMENSLHLLLAAKEVTTDFSEVGWLTGTFGQFVPFMRSSVNGLRAAGRAIARDPVAYLLKASATAVLAAGLWMLVKDEDWWKEMDANSKLRYFHIPIKWGGRDEVLQIPRNQDVDYVFGAGMTAALDSLHQKDPKAAMQWAGELIKSVNPVGAPPLLEEIYEQARNKDSYFGTPVVPPSLEDRPTHQQYNEHTSAVAKAVGSASKAVSDATGKDVRISPVRLDHAIGGLAGGGGRGIIQSLGGSAAEGETELADTPILGRLFRRGGPLGTRPESVADFYDLQHQAEEKHSDIENPESDDDREKRLMMDDAKKGLSAISKMRQAATTVDERRELTRQSIELSKIAIEQYHSDDPDRSSITAAKKFYEYTAAVNGGDIQEARKQLKNLQASAKPRETVKRKLGEPIAKFRARAADQKQEHESARRALQLIRQYGLHAATVE